MKILPIYFNGASSPFIILWKGLYGTYLVSFYMLKSLVHGMKIGFFIMTYGYQNYFLHSVL